MINIATPQFLNLNGFAHVLRDIHAATYAGSREIQLDFRTCEHAYPDGMLPLIAYLAPLRWRDKVDISWIPPDASYLRDVFDGVGWSSALDNPGKDVSAPVTSSHSFTPATSFTTASELEDLRKSIMRVVLTEAKLSTWVPEATEWALWEVMENVLNHAEALRGWVQASTFKKRNHLNLLVVDCGRGLAASLQERYGALNDHEAIKQAVERGGTRNPRTNAGFGLTGCVKIAENNRGAFTIWSGDYRLDFDCGARPAAKAPPVYRYHRQDAHFDGTIVEVELRTDRPVDLKRALGQKSPVRLVELRHDAGDEYIFDFASEAADLGTRQAGANIRTQILNLVQAGDSDRLVLELSAVSMLSSSFADEAIAKLAATVGKDRFFQKFELRGMNESVDAIVQTALWGRLR